MKKNLKNLLLIVLMGLSIIFMGACGEKKLSNEEVITNFVEASKGIKNMKVELKVTLVEDATKNDLMKMSSENLIIKEPFAMKMDRKVMGFTNISYIKDGIDYSLNPFTSKWEKKAIGTEEINELYNSYLPVDDEFYDALKANMDKINVEKKSGNYVLTLTDTEFLKDMITKKFSGFFWVGTKLSDFTFEYIVDGKTFLPVAFNLVIDTLAGADTKVIVNITSKYSEINEIKDIELSDEAKNAEEIKE